MKKISHSILKPIFLIQICSFVLACSSEKSTPQIELKTLSPIGIFLANHNQATGIEEWEIDRWKKEIKDLKKMGAKTIWYLPIQFGQKSIKNFEPGAPFWELQKNICKAIIDEDMEVGIYIGYNDIFPETLNENPGWAALHGRYGMEAAHACPSVPEAQKEIILLRQKVFKELTQIDYLMSPITDYGGCSCSKCAPLPKTYMRSLKQMIDTCRIYHPHVKLVAASHVVRLSEADMLRDLIKDTDWIDGVADIPRGVKPVIKYYMYPEITMIGGWGAYGPCPRIEAIKDAYMNDYKYISGSMNYSEGIHDDINRFAALKFAQDPNRKAYDVALEYAKNWLNLDETNAENTAKIILGMGNHIPRNRDYAGYNEGIDNPLADKRLKSLIAIRNSDTSLVNNYRYWLLVYRAVYECYSTNDGELSLEELENELTLARKEILRLEPEYGAFIQNISFYNKPDVSPWNWPRTFNFSFKRENSFIRETQNLIN